MSNRETGIEGFAESEQGSMAEARDQGQGLASKGQGHAQACDREAAHHGLACNQTTKQLGNSVLSG
jgi:hypothetical protein